MSFPETLLSICLLDRVAYEMKSEHYGYYHERFWDRHFYWQTIWETTSRDALMWMKKAGIKVMTGDKD
jgi:hypothetical protein